MAGPARAKIRDVFRRQRQLGKVAGTGRVADADRLQKAAAAFELLDVAQHFEQALDWRVDAHRAGRDHLAVHRPRQRDTDSASALDLGHLRGGEAEMRPQECIDGRHAADRRDVGGNDDGR